MHMKKQLLPVIFLIVATSVHAQDIQPNAAKSLMQEIGIFGQTETNNVNGSMGMAGLQYKHWHNEHLGFRVIGAFAQYSASGSEIQSISGDTSVTKQQHYDINLPILGVGIEAQRHFYKRIYLFAAAELKGGYGNGNADTLLSKSVGHSSNNIRTYDRAGQRDASLLYVGITASVGAKVQWNRLCVGLEILPVGMAYTKIDDGFNRGGITDFSLGNFSQRLFLHYRF